MTRINTIDPAILSDQHLIAECRELPRIASALKKSLVKHTPDQLDHGFIRGGYRLGSGHVKFFYPLGGFLLERYESLTEEMRNRGFAYAQNRYIDWQVFHQNDFFGFWEPSIQCHEINIGRLLERIDAKTPPWYRLHGRVMANEFWHTTYRNYIETERMKINAGI